MGQHFLENVNMLMAVLYQRPWLRGQHSQPFNDLFKISTSGSQFDQTW